MGAIYLGLLGRDGYLFATNDAFGEASSECALVKINKQCGAIIVTARGDFLRRVRKLLDSCLTDLSVDSLGLSEELVLAIVKAVENNFKEDRTFKLKPLPFLLLFVGYGFVKRTSLIHIFLRNRVLEVKEKRHGKEYVTQFDVSPVVNAKNLFYGHSEIAQLLCAEIPSDALNVDAMKALAYLSISETQKTDSSIFPNLYMAVLSPGKGFEWIKESEVQKIVRLAKMAEMDFSENLSIFFKAASGASCYDTAG